MFSKTRVSETRPTTETATHGAAAITATATPERGTDSATAPAAASRGRVSPSVMSSDLTVTGNIQTQGDIQIEGNVEGDIRAHQLTIGESATIKGEIVGDDIIVNGRVIGRVRGLKVRLTATARVEGDIIHKTIAIESGAHFEGSVQRQEDPLNGGGTKKLAAPAAG